MNVSGTSSSILSLTATQAVSTAQVGAQSDDGSAPDASVHAHRHGGGHMRHAVDQALQSIGLALPKPGAGDSASSSASGSSSDASSVKQDLQSFMHSLFEAVKSEPSGTAATSGAGTSASSSGDPQSSFATGLSSLIAEVGSGSAPADLQSAFSKLASDLQSASGSAASGSTTSTTGASDGSSTATLQAFLTHLQQDLGYGGSGGSSATGSLLTTQV